MPEPESKENILMDFESNMREEIKTEVNEVSLFTSLSYCRIAINVSLVVICIVLFALGRVNAAPIFALIIYNGVHAFLVSYFNRYKTQKFLLTGLRFHYSFNYSEMLAGQISIVIGLLMILFLQYGFANNFDIINKNLFAGNIPLICIAAVIIIRYLGAYLIREDIRKKLLYGKL